MPIAIIDNDPQQRALLMDTLAAAGESYEVFEDLASLLTALKKSEPELLIFHWQPESEGMRALRTLRQSQKNLPLLLITGRAPEHESFSFLADGASDYLVKPLRRSELGIRMRVLLARADPQRYQSESLLFDGYAFDTRAARLKIDGKDVSLTQKEFDLALLFFRNLGQPLSRATILESVWPQDAEFSSRTMDTHVSRVRNKLALKPERGFRLAPVYSYGYRLEKLGKES